MKKETTTTPEKIRFLRLRDVLEVFPVSRATWMNGVASGRFPAPVKLTQKRLAWREADLDALCLRLSSEAEATHGKADD